MQGLPDVHASACALRNTAVQPAALGVWVVCSWRRSKTAEGPERVGAGGCRFWARTCAARTLRRSCRASPSPSRPAPRRCSQSLPALQRLRKSASLHAAPSTDMRLLCCVAGAFRLHCGYPPDSGRGERSGFVDDATQLSAALPLNMATCMQEWVSMRTRARRVQGRGSKTP